MRPNIVIFKYQGMLYENSLTFGGNLIGPARGFSNQFYEENLQNNTLMYASYDQHTSTSAEIASFDINDDETGPVSIETIIAEEKLDDIVSDLFASLMNHADQTHVS